MNYVYKRSEKKEYKNPEEEKGLTILTLDKGY